MKILFLFVFLFANLSFGQVGINSTEPRGALEVSSPQKNLGMVLPSVTKIEDVTNPQTNDGDIPSGTIVFDISRNTICIRYDKVWQCSDAAGQKNIITPPFLSKYSYIKASNTHANAGFGWSVSLSSDGSTMAVGSYLESSDATGINGNQSNTSTPNAGAVYVYKRIGSVWMQEAYIKASNTRAGASFGYSVSLSSDGSAMAVGSNKESSNATGINGDESNTNANSAGAVYVYKRTGSIWAQEAYIKASNTRTDAMFGHSVSLSSDGSTMAIGSIGENSNATGINGDESNASTIVAGAVYVYKRTAAVWSQEAYIKASYIRDNSNFGWSVSLSPDGSTVAVGNPNDNSNATGINGDESNTSANSAGAVHVYKRTGSVWAQEAYIKASNTRVQADFGWSVSLSPDGSTMAVGSPRESSNATGINGDESNTGAPDAGAVYVFKRTGSVWAQEAYIKASNTRADAFFGSSVTLSADGSSMAVGSIGENSNATGINGNESNTGLFQAGAVYVFKRTGSSWLQESYIKASNTRDYALLGWSVSLSSDASIMAVGSFGESSNARGINGDESDTSMDYAGAVYILKNY